MAHPATPPAPAAAPTARRTRAAVANRSARKQTEPTRTEPRTELAPLEQVSTKLERALAERRPEHSEDPRDPKSRASRWANANQRSTSARAEWACQKSPPEAWAQGARPPLLETDSRPTAACEMHPEPAADWRPPRARHHRPTGHSGPRAAAARAPAPASRPTAEARSPPVPKRKCPVSRARPAGSRPVAAGTRQARPASPRRTRWRGGRLLPPSTRSLRQRPRSSRRPVRSRTLRHADHLYSW